MLQSVTLSLWQMLITFFGATAFDLTTQLSATVLAVIKRFIGNHVSNASGLAMLDTIQILFKHWNSGALGQDGNYMEDRLGTPGATVMDS